MNLQIKALSPENVDDYLFFFDNILFQEHPHWDVCYCRYFHFTGSDEEWNNKQANRSKVIELIHAGKMHGYLAFHENRIVGWCHADEKNNLERLKQMPDIWDMPEEKTLSIVCFLVHPDFRRKGIAKALLSKALDDASQNGFDAVEAYPLKDAEGEELNYHGPLNLYLNAGFQKLKEFDNFYLLRREFGADPLA